MRGLLSNYGLSFKLALLLAAGFCVIAAAVAVRRHAAGRSAIGPVSRVLAIGSGLVIAVATAMPYDLPYRREGLGDLVLTLGRGGLSGWRVVYENPNSLAALLLICNVLLYIPLALFGILGWPRSPVMVLGVCLMVSLLVEASQYVLTDRIASLDDVLLNMGGALTGAVLGLIVRRRPAPG